MKLSLISEVVTGGVLQQKVFLEISQNSQENTCARVSFLIKLQVSACNFIEIETLAQVFSCEFCEIFNNTFFTEHPLATASVIWETTLPEGHLQMKLVRNYGSSPPEMFLSKGILKICSKFTGEHPWWSVIYWDCTLAWVFFCKFAAYFQNIFPKNTSWEWLLKLDNYNWMNIPQAIIFFCELLSFALICMAFVFLFLYMLSPRMIWYNFSSFFSVKIECRDSQSAAVHQSLHSL